MKSQTILLIGVLGVLGYVILSRAPSPLQQPVPGSGKRGGGWSVSFGLGQETLAGIGGGIASLFDDGPAGQPGTEGWGGSGAGGSLRPGEAGVPAPGIFS